MFLATWQVGDGMAGAPSVTLACTVDTVHRTINGTGSIFHDTPDQIRSNVHGAYRQMGLFGNRGHVVTLDGFQPIYYGGPARPNEIQNFHASMVLAQDWQSGQGSFTFFNPCTRQWVHVDDVPVTLVPNPAPDGIGNAPVAAPQA